MSSIGSPAELDAPPGVSNPDGDRPLGQIALVDLLDRLLGTGVVVAGDVVISLSGVDLVQVRLHALLATIRSDMVGGR